eukprot:GFUD01136724.1.p1 GENE.GFUD01136724.1~~GFUD01136724.1.p1  ORF type:complete len:712 (-),score=170.30 GFUD01136724.1:71-2206(-)
MRLLTYSLLLIFVFGHLYAKRRTDRSSSRSSSGSSSSWGSRSSSTGRKSFGTKIKEKLGFKKKPVSTGSSYPTQQWGSSGGTGGSRGTSSGMGGGFSQPNPQSNNFGSSGGFSQPKPSANNFGGGTPIGGFSQPKAPSNNFGAGTVAAGGLAGAGVGGLAGSHIGGGGFSQPKPMNNFGAGGFGNSNPGNSFGAGGFNNKPIGGGGFVQPKPAGNNFGGGFTNSNPVSAGNNYGGGFGNQGNSFGSGGFNTKPSGSGSNWKNVAGAGLAGGGLAGLAGGYKKNPMGVSQYSAFSKPKQSFGSHLFGGKKVGYKTPGYGTSWGTNFAGGAGQFGKQKKKGISKKMLGLGIGAGFLGGAALGVAGTMATYSVYHRYQEFKRMMHVQRPSMGGFDDNYYNNYYQKNECMGGCPMNAHCEWGFCECNAGSTRQYGRCESNWANIPPRPSSFDPFQTCSTTATCMAMDMNLICNTDLTTQGNVGKCECRRDMKWNTQTGECQVFLDVDCSRITYETPPSAAIMSAVGRAEMAGISQVQGETEPLGRTETMQESLSNSLLSQMDAKQASEADLREAFCRDVDSFSLEFQPSGPSQVVSRTALQPIRDERPPNCDVVPHSACAVAYDSSSCTGGWKLVIPMGELRFRWFTSYYTYRNDMDTIGIRAGCTFTGYSDSSFNGNRIDIKADSYDRWVVFADHAEYRHMDADIESIRCVCRH